MQKRRECSAQLHLFRGELDDMTVQSIPENLSGIVIRFIFLHQCVIGSSRDMPSLADDSGGMIIELMHGGQQRHIAFQDCLTMLQMLCTVQYLPSYQ